MGRVHMPTPGEGYYVVGGAALPRTVNGETVWVKPGEPYPEAFEIRAPRRRAMVEQNLLRFIPRVGIPSEFVEESLLPKLSPKALKAIADDLKAVPTGETKEALIEAIMSALGFAKRAPDPEPASPTQPSNDSTRETLESLSMEELREMASVYDLTFTDETTREELIGSILLASG